MSHAEVDWVEGYRPTAEEAMRDNGRVGAALRGGAVIAGRYKLGAMVDYQTRMPRGELGYGLVGIGVHLALQDDPSNYISWGGAVDVQKLISTVDAIDAASGWRIFPHLVWDYYLPIFGPGNRHALELRLGLFVEFGMDGPLMTEMSGDVTFRPQIELGWSWAGF